MDLTDPGTFSENFLLMADSQCFKRMLLEIFHFWQNDTFEPLHDIQKDLFCPKHCFEAL